MEINPEQRDDAFWATHAPGLVWSNSKASNRIMIANALLKPNFHLLLDIAAHFGLDCLDQEWMDLQRDIAKRGFREEVSALNRACPIVERCLRHMHQAIVGGLSPAA